jgi:protein subunit release factor A
VFFEAGASRGGGQKMNRTHSMARVVHLPTKTTARCQDTRWPKENQELALLNVRYQLDKLEKQNSIVARYEAELEEFLKNEKINKEKNRDEEVEARFSNS